ncbi:UBC20 [Auxenochlorella protothecoides x Auxenochlorella symbiontica]|uniref:E2 ubiquitin-conjugating enzyme n=3 Tax=Auxenochlorella protothecoides TaxID=3075 RepID=A0A1D1ZM41_AUXPR
MSLAPAAVTKLLKEYRDLQANPIDGVKVFLNEDDVSDIQAEYVGPAGTPFEGGTFRMKLVFPQDFPTAAPKGYFLTRIFHPNVSTSGDICVNTLKRDWTPDLGLRHILTVIRCLLVEPNPESALNEEAGRLLLEGFPEFARKAALITSVHATRQTPLTATGGANTVNAEGCGDDAGKPAPRSLSAAPGVRKAAPEKKRSLKRL